MARFLQVRLSLSRGALPGLFALVGAAGIHACDVEPDIVASELEASASTPGGAGGAGMGGDSIGPPPPPIPPMSVGGAPGVPTPLTLSGDLEVHDPEVVVTTTGSQLFFTGRLIPTKSSDDLLEWSNTGRALDEVPAWVDEQLEGITDLWAPDVSFFGGEYHLYFAASTFGTGVSCIGHATAPELEAATTWQDEGWVICSDVEEIVDWDAIDPSTFADEDGAFWMVFGSYSSGIKLIPLDDDGARLGTDLFDLAERPEEVAIQAPTALFHEGNYYLFASFDQCCAGVNSTSNIRVGRSDSVIGPYVDRDGVPLLEGGGTPFIVGNDTFRGAGANTIFSVSGELFTAYHAYDASAAGQATLRIAPLLFDTEGWPIPHDP